jgi:hypothetical protein
MPYIAMAIRNDLFLTDRAAGTPGELTYLLTYHVLDAVPDDEFVSSAIDGEIARYLEGKQHNYALLSSVVGCLECARREYRRRRPDDYLAADEALADAIERFYRLVIAPYEDEKIVRNGDVF